MAAQLLGKVDLLGLNAMGLPAGVHPLLGVLVGGGISTATSAMSKSRHAELFGLLAGVAAGGALYAAGPKYRSMGIGAIAGSIAVIGFRWLERILAPAKTSAAAAATTGTQGIGMATMQALNGLGIPTMQALNGSLGLPSMANTPIPAGTIPGVAGIQVSGQGMSSPPVSLLGQRTGTNGPSISGLSTRYGATLLGQR